MTKLTSVLWKEPTRTPNASEYVARGCALRCAMLSPAHNVKQYKVHDIFPYSIGFPVEGGINETQQEVMVFPKGSQLPSDGIIKYPGTAPLHIKILYTNKTDFPVGISPQVGSFMITYPEATGEEKVRVEIKVKLIKHGIFELESASLLEDKGPANEGLFSSSEKIVADNLPLSENLDVATTKSELHEAQKKEQILVEQDIKAKQFKEHIDTVEYFIHNPRNKAEETRKGQASRKNYGLSENLFGEMGKNKGRETKQSMSDVPENKNKDENARVQATKPLLTCIADYRSFADSLPPIQKEEVFNECVKAEQWLIDQSQHHSSPDNNVDPVHWSSIIKYSVKAFERRCEHIMRSKPLYDMEDIPRGMQVD